MHGRLTTQPVEISYLEDSGLYDPALTTAQFRDCLTTITTWATQHHPTPTLVGGTPLADATQHLADHTVLQPCTWRYLLGGSPHTISNHFTQEEKHIITTQPSDGPWAAALPAISIDQRFTTTGPNLTNLIEHVHFWAYPEPLLQLTPPQFHTALHHANNNITLLHRALTTDTQLPLELRPNKYRTRHQQQHDAHTYLTILLHLGTHIAPNHPNRTLFDQKLTTLKQRCTKLHITAPPQT